MKKSFLLFIIFINISNLILSQSRYDNGYSAGYLKGFCYKANYNGKTCIEPIPPLAPLPKLNENNDNYTDGYNRGYVEGINAYDNQSTNLNSQKPYEYKDPSKVDLSPIFEAQSILQSRYDNNVQRVQQEINSIIYEINNLDLTQDQKNEVLKKFKEILANNVNGKNINYSNLNHTNSLLNYLNSSMEIIIQNVKEPKQKIAKKETEPTTKIEDTHINPFLKTYSGTQAVVTMAPILDRPNMGENEIHIGVAENNTIIILEKINDKFYKIKSGEITGYMCAVWFKN